MPVIIPAPHCSDSCSCQVPPVRLWRVFVHTHLKRNCNRGGENVRGQAGLILMRYFHGTAGNADQKERIQKTGEDHSPVHVLSVYLAQDRMMERSSALKLKVKASVPAIKMN